MFVLMNWKGVPSVCDGVAAVLGAPGQQRDGLLAPPHTMSVSCEHPSRPTHVTGGPSSNMRLEIRKG